MDIRNKTAKKQYVFGQIQRVNNIFGPSARITIIAGGNVPVGQVKCHITDHSSPMHKFSRAGSGMLVCGRSEGRSAARRLYGEPE
jgi:hypothetical protein